jgi:phosphopantetheine adenylyltransferase
MKQYRQLVKELPSKKVVFAFGRFQPPTTGHELLVNAVKKLAGSTADHVIYASKTEDKKSNPLPVARKVYFLKRMFPKTNFIAASAEVRTFIEAAKELNKKYKNLVMVAGSDRINEYDKILNKYNGTEFNFDTIEVVSAGERDPDSDTASGMSGTKMREAAVAGDFNKFKKGLPHTLTELDGRRLMNDIRKGMGHPIIKESFAVTTNILRERYINEEIFLIGDKVQDANGVYEIMDRGTNYITVADSVGNLSKKWLDQITESEITEDVQGGYAPKEVSFKGYTTKNLHHSADATDAFMQTIRRQGDKDPVAVLNALKATDTYMQINDLHLTQGGIAPDQAEIKTWIAAHDKAKESLDRVGEFLHHEDYWHMHQHELEGLLTNYKETGKDDMNEELSDKTIKGSDKIKVARIIANTLGVENAEATSDPTQLVNSGLRKVRGKAFNADSLKIIGKMLQLASEVGIQYDNNLVPTKLKEDLDEAAQGHTIEAQGIRGMKATPWRKTFKSHEHLAKWADANDSVEVHGTRDLEQAKKGNLSPAIKEADLEKFKKYTRPVVKTTPKIERTTNPAGRTTDHVEWKVTTPTGEIHRHKTKKEAQAHFDSFSEGTVQPNGTDKIDVLSSAPTDRTKTVYYKDFKKMIQKEEVVDKKDNESDHDYDASATAHPHTQVGHAMTSTTDSSNIRRQKIRYRLGEEVELNEGHYETAEAHRAKAMAAKQKGDAESYHHHMSNHYDSIAQWHDSKGRHNMSDISAEKAEKHHEASINGGKLKTEDVSEEPAMKHRVAVTVSDPNHTAVSKRKEQIQKFAKVTAGSEEDAVKKASAHFKKAGFKIHGAEHHSMVKEDLDEEAGTKPGWMLKQDPALAKKLKDQQDRKKFVAGEPTKKEVKEDLVNELSNDTLGSYKKKAGEQASAADKVGDTKKADKRFSGIIKATKKQFVNDLRKESYYVEVIDALTEAITAIDKGEYDYEGQMARTQLQTTLRNCKDLIDMVKDDDNMPEWVQSKITLAQDYITTVRDYLQSKEELVAEGLQPDNDPFFDEDADTELSDDDMDDMINNTHDDEFMDAYEDDEFHIIDMETGEPVEDEEEVNEESLMEVLSRSERLRAKMRFAKTKSKRERRMMIVLKTRSNTETLNKRARRMAIQLMKKRIAKKPLSQLSIGEKERLERVIQSRKQLIGRIAMKLTPRMRKIEQNRLSHTKGGTGSTNNAL